MRTAFTLIELLVVITIIVVLLALLTPAMDKAIYQAELATCASRLKAVATSVSIYATGNSRRYPNRPALANHGVQPSRITVRLTALFGTDERPVLRQYLSLNQNLLDPMVVPVDFEASHDDTDVFVSYSLWYGGGFSQEKAMRKLGDRFTWTHLYAGGRTVTQSFELLAGDVDVIRGAGNLAYASHPDYDGVLVNNPIQDARQIYHKQTSSHWGAGVPMRGAIDLNFAYQDGSVIGYKEVPFQAGQPGAEEHERYTGVPEDMANSGPASWHNVPKR